MIALPGLVGVSCASWFAVVREAAQLPRNGKETETANSKYLGSHLLVSLPCSKPERSWTQLKHLSEFIVNDLLPLPRSTIGASLTGCLQFVVSQTASSERSAPALTNWIRYGLEPCAATAAAGVSVSLCPPGLLLPWSMRTGWKMLINLELFLFPPLSLEGRHAGRSSHMG